MPIVNGEGPLDVPTNIPDVRNSPLSPWDIIEGAGLLTPP